MKLATYFTTQHDVVNLISNELAAAEKEINVAVAWFTIPSLFRQLVRKAHAGVRVRVVMTDHEFNWNSRNDYDELTAAGGQYHYLGADDHLMHMKFCTIDDRVLISGSANWTKAAFTKHHESVTFSEGFEEEVQNFKAQFEQLWSLVPVDDYTLTNNGEPGIASVEEVERTALRVRLRLLTASLSIANVEYAETERLFDLFNHYFTIELYPLRQQIINLKKRWYAILKQRGYQDPDFEEFIRQEEERRQAYEAEKDWHIPDLNEIEIQSLKEMYREASRLCHEDSTACVFHDKQKAGEVFSALTEAYKNNDIATVRRILDNLRTGQPVESEEIDDLAFLRRRVVELKERLQVIQTELAAYRTHELFDVAVDQQVWPEFFLNQKKRLRVELHQLKHKMAQASA